MTEIYLGNPPANIKTWIEKHSEQEDPLSIPLTFTAEEDSTIQLKRTGMSFASGFNGIEYKKNSDEWTTFITSSSTSSISPIISLAAGDKISFRAVAAGNEKIADSPMTLQKFVMTGKIAASGNIQSLLAQDFEESTIAGGYFGLFSECNVLTKAPLLPAITLTTMCYNNLFAYCTALTEAPKLPADTLVSGCYGEMFLGCSKLSSVDVNFTTWVTYATDNWLMNAGTEATGTKTFTCPSTLPQTTGNKNIPTGWTIITK